MTHGERLFVSCIKRKDNRILSLVQRKWLDGDEVRQYKFIMDYYREHGEMVGIKTFCDKFKLDAGDADSRPAFYLDALKERFIFSAVSDNVPKILRGIKDDPRGKLSELQSLVGSLAVDAIESRDVLYSDDVEIRRDEYENRTKTLGVTYLSMGCEDMDKTFYGYRKNDLITIGGRSGSGKSWALCFLSVLLENSLKERHELTGETFGDILFITNEMSEGEINERMDCINFKLPYERFMKGTLTEREKSRYYRGLEQLKKERSKIRIVGSCQTIDELTTKVGLYQPCIVFLDGSYLMESKLQEGWEKITYITRNLKRIAKSSNVPIVNTTQLRRGSAKGVSKVAFDGQDDFAYSSSFVQDSDIAIRMYQDADMKFHDLVGMEVVKGRRAVIGSRLIFQNDLNKMLQSITIPADETVEPETRTDF